MSDCKVFRREIGGAAGRTDLGAGAAAHADTCRACGEALREREAVRGLVRSLGKVEAPADFEFRLRARMAAANGAGRRGPLGGLRPAYRFAPAAFAAVLLLVAATLYLRQGARTDGGGAAPSGVAREVVNNAAVQTPAPPAQTGLKEVATARVSEADRANEEGRVNEAGRAEGPKARISRASAPRPRQSARRVTEVARGAAGAGQPAALNTTVASVSSAEVVIPGRALPFTMETGATPLRLVMRDGRGAARVVPLLPVSFGAQDLIARDGARRRTTASDDEGVW